ncbi:MAG: hypothetical protein ACYC5H_12175 [Methylovirgula sp.]
MSFVFAWPRVRVPDHPRTLVAKGVTVWIWPGISLTRQCGDEILPVAAEAIHFWITRLHGPGALDKDILRAIAIAADYLKAGDEHAAQQVLDALRLTELSQDGAVLTRAVADHLGIEALNLPLRASMRTWTGQDIALHLPIFKRHVDAARALAKGAIPFDPLKHPRWSSGAPDSQGGEFAPGDGSGAAVIPVASRGSRKPPYGEPHPGEKPKPPSSPVEQKGPGVRYLKPGEFPEGMDAPDSPQQQPNLLGPEDLNPGIGHNSGNPNPLDNSPDAPPPPPPPPELPPEIPEEPLSDKARNLFIKAAIRWIVRALIVAALPELAPYLLALQTTYWVAAVCWPYIRPYFDPPKTFEELQADALNPQPGYDIHHPVEQTPAKNEGYPKGLWDGPGNRVRIPTLKHWEITGWYMTPNEEYDGLTPRAYLKGKSWEEKVRVGRKALIEAGVLTP